MSRNRNGPEVFEAGDQVPAGGSSASKWSVVKPRATQVRDTSLEVWPDMVDVMSEPLRWSPTCRAELLKTNAQIKTAFCKMKPEFNTATVLHAWAASYNMVAHKTLSTMSVDEDVLTRLMKSGDYDHMKASLCPVALCTRETDGESGRRKVRYWVSAALVRKKHALCEAYLEKVGMLTWHSLSNFTMLIDIIKDSFAKVRDGVKVEILRLFLSHMGSVASAKVKAFKTVVVLEKPSANFLKKLHSDSEQQGEEGQEDAVTGAAGKQQPKQGDGYDAQAVGLDLLAEEAEATADHTESGNEEENAFGADDDGDDGDDFQLLLRSGIDRAFAQHDAQEDEELESRTEQHLEARYLQGNMI